MTVLPALEASGVVKTFGGTVALADAHLRVGKGTIHALLGGNGSGKSTLIKCLAGVYRADSGRIVVHGEERAAADQTPAVARRSGLHFVHQDLGLFPQLSIAENIALDRGYPTARVLGGVRWSRLEADTAALLERFEIAASPRTPVAALRPSQRSLVAIARALADAGDDAILMLDEPTATLAEHESQELLAALRKRANRGQTIVLVSHRFPEVQGVADDVTVFRDGRVAATDAMSEMPIDRLVAAMTGGAELPHPERTAVRAGSAERLRITGLHAGALRGVDLTLAAGEIVGLAGLGGSGRSSLLRTVFGRLPIRAGSMELDGAPYSPHSAAQAMALDVALVPEDRLGEAAFLDLSVRENTSITVLKRFWRRLAISPSAERSSAEALVAAFGIRTPGIETPLGSLSGGNQQKAILARWLQRAPKLLLLDEPSQGVDVVARSEISAHVVAAADAGAGVIVASSDLDELFALTHRIVVLRAGRIVADLTTSSTTRDEVAHLSMLDSEEGIPT
ncbi:sugar ABC transporter ATP-binding protein [Pseudolysinimonas yzui]|uniref:Ribose import ATP-binding protein RbsA n=1 Tax=Pseudolysinimonas yzui TaxID=2708254 RepID=A0A8J3M520_9MICO|nr:sugar ABC transporter ATP-binding protein [Pseudolysinimonas yzui]GHF19073.1 ribose import ATP-binding protein RbsA [Pseudolysinimonas yzui]